ncbi:hypothetical protein PC116_g4053 [Phytophthora cactorum]|nr:hypothetical protein PC116_g4053 [Phytophthora cactorum]
MVEVNRLLALVEEHLPLDKDGRPLSSWRHKNLPSMCSTRARRAIST